MAQNPLKVFISYSHKDRGACEELKSHLQPFADKHLIVVWVDDRTLAGEEWEGPVSDNLNSAHLTILLLSPSFINSRYCKEIEMRRAFERAKSRGGFRIYCGQDKQSLRVEGYRQEL